MLVKAAISICFMLGAIMSITLPAHASKSLCEGTETTLFSCILEENPEILSLCASSDLSPTAGYIQYRQMHKDDIEFSYPHPITRPKGRFTFGRIQYIGAAEYNVSFTYGDNTTRTLKYLASGTDESADEYTLTITEAGSEMSYARCDRKSVINTQGIFTAENPVAKRAGMTIEIKEADE